MYFGTINISGIFQKRVQVYLMLQFFNATNILLTHL